MTNLLASPWIERFAPLLERKEIRRRAHLPGLPLPGLNDMPTEVACVQLRAALERVFVPTAQCIDVLLRFVELAMGHCALLYPSARQYLEARYMLNLPSATIRPVCLTGLAGVGKSHILQALRRVFPPDTNISLPSHPRIPLVGHWGINVRNNTTLSAMVLPLLKADPSHNNPRVRNADLITVARREAFQNGVSLLTADEFQFATQSHAANARVTQLLLSLTYLNVPIVYAANFSLCHRLMRRPQEDRQRLLADPIVLEPEPPNGADWQDVLKEYKNIAPDALRFDPIADGELLHQYTAGVRRLVPNLLEIAYRRSRLRGGQSIGRTDIEGSYLSPDYTANRRDVELIHQQTITGRRAREDLWCPIDLPPARQADHAAQLVRTRSELVASKMVQSSMTDEEREAFRVLTSSSGAANRRTAKVVRMKRQKASKSELLQNVRAFREQQEDDG